MLAITYYPMSIQKLVLKQFIVHFFLGMAWMETLLQLEKLCQFFQVLTCCLEI